MSEDVFLEIYKKLSEDSKLYCEGKMTITECYNALKELKWNNHLEMTVSRQNSIVHLAGFGRYVGGCFE